MHVKHFNATFTVTATLDEYATEVYYLREDKETLAPGAGDTLALDRVFEVQVDAVALPTSAVIEIDVLKPGGNPATAGDWRTARSSISETGLATPLALSLRRGVRIRCKSGGTGGSGEADVSWWSGE